MVGGLVLLVASDAAAKWLTAGYPVSEVISLRGVLVVFMIVAIAARRRTMASLRVRNRRGQALRASLATVSSFAFIFGLSLLPLADATAATYTGPLFATALAAPILAERVGVARWLAVITGFAGMLLMLRPGASALNWAILLPAAAALFGALRDLVTRRISVTESSWSILLTSNLSVVAVGFVLGVSTGASTWSVPSTFDLALMALSGLLLGTAHFLHIEAYRYAQASTVGPFRYTSLLWAVLIGFVVWGELPDTWVLAGAALVIASGLYVLKLEWRRRD